MNDPGPADIPRADYPVAVRLRREMLNHRGWPYPRWSLVEVRAQSQAEVDEQVRCTVLAEEGEARDLLWTGLRVRLNRSQAETYWFNLQSTRPSLFVVCREDLDGGMVPVMVSADHDAASREMEGDAEVFATELPGALHDWLERFVVAHFRPREKGGERRRRKPLDGGEPTR